jgi:hypothetical protein
VFHVNKLVCVITQNTKLMERNKKVLGSSLTFFVCEAVPTISDVVVSTLSDNVSVSGWHALLSRAMHDGT